ncbi:hypothetical protein AYI68_g1692 [Smittium mucronatum]|uniref:Uncharacterized protein n=1 Tax=Smittium mucronatum TaxID=133383 RepID=A0A1R0H4Z9_9FUNG|nr:hypothetical protein AYI68_g1692 [Smittium mucronatum]
MNISNLFINIEQSKIELVPNLNKNPDKPKSAQQLPHPETVQMHQEKDRPGASLSKEDESIDELEDWLDEVL